VPGVEAFIRRAGRLQSALSITYRSEATGKVVRRTIQPYEIKKVPGYRGRVVYATKTGGKRVQAFYLRNIQSVEPVGKSFKAKWPVKT